MQEIIQGNWLINDCESLDDFADTLERLGYVVEGQMDMARLGWLDELPAALELAEATAEKLYRSRAVATSFEPVWDTSGAEVDVARYLGGEPECMIDFPAAPNSTNPVIALVACASFGMVSSRDVLARGQAVCALALALQNSGHSVEIYSDNVTRFKLSRHDFCTQADNPLHTVRVKVKGANDVLDPARLMFALAHKQMGRLGDLFFGNLKDNKWAADRDQYGASAGNPVAELYPEGSLVLPAVGDGGHYERDSDAALRFVMDQIDKLGLLAE